MFATVTPLAAATQQNTYPQHRKEGISSAAKLVYFVGLLAFTIFGGGFFAILLAGQRGYGMQPQPLANRASRRDVCTDAPIGVAMGHELLLSQSSQVLGSHNLAKGADGKYLQTWKGFGISYRLIDTLFNPGNVHDLSIPGSTAAIGWQRGNYSLFANSESFNSISIGSVAISSAGDSGTYNSQNYTTARGDPFLSITSLPSGEAAVCTTTEPFPLGSTPWLHIFTPSGTRNSYKAGNISYATTLVSCSALSNSNIVYFWVEKGICGLVVTKTNSIVVASKTILPIDLSVLVSTVLFNQKVVLAWVDSATSRVAFQIMDATLSNPSSVIVADSCSSGAQSDPQLINFWDGFVLVLTSDDESGKGVYGYRFGPDGKAVGGRFQLNLSTGGDQTNPIVAPLGSSGIYTGWSSAGTMLVTRPFDLDRAPYANGLIPLQSAYAGSLFNLNLTGYIEDPDTSTGFDRLTYSLFNTPPWLSFNGGTLIASGTPSLADTGTQTLIFKGDDLHGKSINQTFTITTNNKAPHIAWQPDDVQLVLNAYYYLPISLIFKDPEGFPVNITVTGNPSWLAFINQALSGTASTLGLSTLNITGTDPFGASNFTSFTMDVISAGSGNHPPQVNTLIPSVTKDGGTPFTYSIPSDAFTDPDGNLLTLFASLPSNAPLPPWLLFDGQLGIFTGNPTNVNAGQYTIVIKAIDPSGASALQTFTMTIKDSTNLPPYVLSPLPVTTAFVGQLFKQYVGGIFANLKEGDTLTLSASFSPNVTWITFDATQASLSGTPGHGDVFPVSAIFIARNKEGLSATSTVTINVQGDNWFVYLFKIVGPIFSVLGALATLYKGRHWIRDKALLLKRKISPITTTQGAIGLNAISKEADDAPLLQDA